MKKTLQTLVLLLVALLPVTASARDLLGDVNQDDHVNISDVTSLISYLLSSDSDTYGTTNADVNRDGLITIADVSVLINHLLNGGEPNPPVTETFEVNGVKFTMVKVEGGTFTMGATAEQGDEYEPDELPTHQVTLSTYSIGQTEVTQELWQAVMGYNNSMIGSESEDWKQLPVDNVSWRECQLFIIKLNELTGRHFRLPTEAEWEFAARGGNRSQGYKYAGSNTLEDVAWYSGNSMIGDERNRAGVPDPGTRTRGVAKKQPNELGLYDMIGNVKELCQDMYGDYVSMAQTNPVGPTTESELVHRGGGCTTEPQYCRVSCRFRTYSTDFWAYGLRLALEEENSPKFRVSEMAVPLVIGGSKSVDLLNGSGDYTISRGKYGDYYYDYQLDGDHLSVTGRAVGNSALYVKDNSTGMTTVLNIIVDLDSVIMSGITMVSVKGGTFMMGATAEQGDEYSEDERPVHQVTVSDFFISLTEVPQMLWWRMMWGTDISDPSYFHYEPIYEMPAKGDKLRDNPYIDSYGIDNPVEHVTWYDCQRFIAKLNKETGKHFRLPTEAEWEFAARGGNLSRGYKYSGSDSINDLAMFRQEWGPLSIPRKMPNELGLYNMSGNVWEWCQDWYSNYGNTAQIDPRGTATGYERVARGGGWNNTPSDCRVSRRDCYHPGYASYNLGLRLAHDAEDSPKFRLSETVMELELGESLPVDILNGSGSYTFSVTEGEGCVNCSLNGNTLNVMTVEEGLAIIRVTDNTTGAFTELIIVVVDMQFETKTFTVNGVSFKMYAVMGGKFRMGATSRQASQANENENPVHEVTLSNYRIGETEVTQALWQAVMGSNPSYFLGDMNRPVESVSWKDCQTFIAKLNELTGRKVRLPTEAEWEYAARGRNDMDEYLYAGSWNIDDVAWYYDNSYAVGMGNPDYGTHPVGTKYCYQNRAYDMSGNVWEWCQDWYGAYSSEPQTDPTGPTTGSYRVMRGGSWCNSAKYCRVSCRNYNEPDYAEYHVGLRLAL